jgi:hypothetical protein
LGLFQHIEVMPAVSSAEIEEVLVVGGGEPNQAKN